MGNFEDVSPLDMSYGHPEVLAKTMPSISEVTGNFGTSYRSARRARGIVVSASLCLQEEGFRDIRSRPAIAETPDTRCLKIGWDETSMRMFCPLSQAQKLFPSLGFVASDDLSLLPPIEAEEPRRKKARKHRAAPAFRMQIMQQCAFACCADAKGTDSMTALQTSPTIVKSTSAKDLWSGATCIEHVEKLKEGLSEDGIGIVSAHADSLESNKNVVTQIALENENLFVDNSVCMG